VRAAEDVLAALWLVWLVRAAAPREAGAARPDVREDDGACPSRRLGLRAGVALSARVTAAGRALTVAGPRCLCVSWPGASRPKVAPPPAITTAATVATVAGVAPTEAPGWANCAALRADRSRPEACEPLPG
jgi:hypothetical protein